MPRRLQPHEVPNPSALQIAELGDRQVLLRGPRGASIVGIARQEIERVWQAIDGRRSVGDLLELCELPHVVELLHEIGALGRAGPATDSIDDATPTASHGAPVRVLGEGRLALRLAELLQAPRLDRSHAADLVDHVSPRDLLVVALDDCSYSQLFEVQKLCQGVGVTCLFVTSDADGIRIGPWVVPGLGPCLGCAQFVSFRGLGIRGDLLEGVAQFRTAPASASELAARVVVREVTTAATGGLPDLLAAVRLLQPSGTATRYDVARVPDCPLCRDSLPAGDREPRLAKRLRRQLVASYRRSPRLLAAAANRKLSVGILGGGTAGYLTALALRRKLPWIDVTLIESRDVPIIGVGEATTPLMPQFLHVDLGLDVHELFRDVQPTLKLGIRLDWGAGFNYPFGPVHALEAATFDNDLRGCSLTSRMMVAGHIPIHRQGDGWRSELDLDVAYHLDNERFVRYLVRQAERRGVEAVDARIVDAVVNNSRVTELVAEDGRRFSFDLYIDCSGFRSLLLEKALGSPFVSYDNSLFTDCAMVAPVPHGGVVQPYTRAETLSSGWCWSTPQSDADHRGYVFCSAFQTPEEAEEEMRGGNPGMGEARLVRFRAGRHEHFWHGNVVAMGNAYGFVEPLESTALHMLIRQIGMLTQALPSQPEEHGLPMILNRRVGELWDYLQWFLALHFRFNQRLDTSFWRHCRAEVDVSRHQELITTFQERGPLSYDRSLRHGFPYPDPLWGAEGIDVLLLGQDVPTQLPQPLTHRATWRERTLLEGQIVGDATPHAKALALLSTRAELLEHWVGVLRRRGPAFS